MSLLEGTHTANDLATSLQVTTEFVYDQCRGRKWPHLKVGKLVRFTDEHVERIEALIEVPAKTAPAPSARARNQKAKRLLGAS